MLQKLNTVFKNKLWIHNQIHTLGESLKENESFIVIKSQNFPGNDLKNIFKI